jgi:integrase
MIDKKYSPKHGRKMWGYDERFLDGAGRTKRVRRYEFETRDEAEEMVAALRRAEREREYGLSPLINRPTLQELIEKRIPTLAERAERSRARRVLYTWLSLLDARVKLDKTYSPLPGYRSPVKIDEVDTPKIRIYVIRRQGEKQSAASINRELNIIGATLHQAEEFFSELKQWKAPKIPRLKVVKSRRERLITEDEYDRLVAHLRRGPDELDGDGRSQNRQNAYQARVRVAQILEFAMLTAARHGEIVALKWSDISWERSKVLIYQKKTGDYKEVPLIPSLKALLEERKPATGRFVFTEGGNIYPKFYRVLKEACGQLGIPYGKNIEDGLVLHAARHTVTTRLVEAGLDYDTIGLITGHRAKELIAHYSHKHPASVARAAEALEKIHTRREES